VYCLDSVAPQRRIKTPPGPRLAHCLPPSGPQAAPRAIFLQAGAPIRGPPCLQIRYHAPPFALQDNKTRGKCPRAALGLYFVPPQVFAWLLPTVFAGVRFFWYTHAQKKRWRGVVGFVRCFFPAPVCCVWRFYCSAILQYLLLCLLVIFARSRSLQLLLLLCHLTYFCSASLPTASIPAEMVRYAPYLLSRVVLCAFFRPGPRCPAKAVENPPGPRLAPCLPPPAPRQPPGPFPPGPRTQGSAPKRPVCPWKYHAGPAAGAAP
jgi:hypothetical protein